MSTPKKWMGLAALGAAATALVSRLWHRDGSGDTPPEHTKPVETTD